jgi:hypothetical protein
MKDTFILEIMSCRPVKTTFQKNMPSPSSKQSKKISASHWYLAWLALQPDYMVSYPRRQNSLMYTILNIINYLCNMKQQLYHRYCANNENGENRQENTS